MLIDSIFCFWKVNRFFHLEISMNCSKLAVNIAENSPYNTNSKWMKHFFIHRSEWACKWNGIPRVTNLMEPINPFPFSMLFKSNQIQLFLTRPWKGIYTCNLVSPQCIPYINANLLFEMLPEISIANESILRR